ncbi:hypothetical protein BOX15_Mlig008015g2, partial [Macrostomum lignano]
DSEVSQLWQRHSRQLVDLALDYRATSVRLRSSTRQLRQDLKLALSKADDENKSTSEADSDHESYSSSSSSSSNESLSNNLESPDEAEISRLIRSHSRCLSIVNQLRNLSSTALTLAGRCEATLRLDQTAVACCPALPGGSLTRNQLIEAANFVAKAFEADSNEKSNQLTVLCHHGNQKAGLLAYHCLTFNVFKRVPPASAETVGELCLRVAFDLSAALSCIAAAADSKKRRTSASTPVGVDLSACVAAFRSLSQ